MQYFQSVFLIIFISCVPFSAWSNQPQLNFFEEKPTTIPNQVTITLHGNRKGGEINYQVSTLGNNQTLVIINTMAGAPIQLTLSREK